MNNLWRNSYENALLDFRFRLSESDLDFVLSNNNRPKFRLASIPMRLEINTLIKNATINIDFICVIAATAYIFVNLAEKKRFTIVSGASERLSLHN